MRNFTNITLLLVLSIFFSCSQDSGYSQKILVLSNKSITKLPDSILEMKHLECLVLGNSFTLYPPLSALGIMPRSNDQSDNRLTYLPIEISDLKNLRSLYLTANKLTALPIGFHNLENLDTLDLSYNENFDLKNGYNELEKMPGLIYLNLVQTKFESRSVEKLKIALPKTRIVTKFEEEKIEIEESN